MFVTKSCFEILYRMAAEGMGGRSGKNFQPFGVTGERLAGIEKTASVLLFASTLALNFYSLDRSHSSAARDPLIQILGFIVGPEGRQPRQGHRNSGDASSDIAAAAVGSGLRKEVRRGEGRRNVRDRDPADSQAFSSPPHSPSAPSALLLDDDGREAQTMPILQTRGSGRRSCGEADDSWQDCSPCPISTPGSQVVAREGNEGDADKGVQMQEQQANFCSNFPLHDDDDDSSGTDSKLLLGRSLRPSSVSSSAAVGAASGRESGGSGCCRHTLLQATSCASHAAKGAGQMFAIGSAIQLCLNLLKKRKTAFASRDAFAHQILLQPDSLKFALFLSNLVLVYRSSACLLTRLTGSPDPRPLHRMISGFLSGCSMLWYPSPQICLHTFWKTVFTMFLASGFGKSSAGQAALYAYFVFADSFLISCSVMEPRFVPRSYLRLIDSFTGSYLTRFNVASISNLSGNDNEIRYGKHFPDLDADHVSRQYMQTIACWSLERRE